MNLEEMDDQMSAMQDNDSSPKDSSSTSSQASATAKPKSTRGFASMDPAKQREIARKGGKAAHEKGTAHEFTPDEARAAGRKGGEAVSRDRRHMAEIGREGGQARGQRVAQRKEEMMRRQQTGNVQSIRSENDAEAADTGLTGNGESGSERQSKAS